MAYAVLFAICAAGICGYMIQRSRSIERAVLSLRRAGYEVTVVSSSRQLGKSAWRIRNPFSHSLRIKRDLFQGESELDAVQAELTIVSPQVETFDCPFATVSDSSAHVFQEMTRLRFLRVGSSALSDSGARSLAGLNELKWIQLRCGQVTTNGLDWLGECRSLRHLEVYEAQIGANLFKRLCKLPCLEFLCIAETRIDPVAICHLKNAKTLRSVNLASTSIDDSVASTFAELYSVDSIDLSHTRVGDEVCVQLSKLSNLRTITLDETRVSNAGIQALLSGRARIETLSVQDCQITAFAFLRPVVPTGHLKRVALNGTPIAGSEICSIIETHKGILRAGYNAAELESDEVKEIDRLLASRRETARKRRR